ncbi:MAG: hypothetical protein G3I09_02525 [Ferrovum sp.]|nr:hypothetical protein [Ferrovum sp.]
MTSIDSSLLQDMAQAYRHHTCLPVPAEFPESLEAAYRAQEEFIQRLGEAVVAWKVGLGPMGVWGSPLPSSALRHSPDAIMFLPHQVKGVELELAFRLTPAALSFPDRVNDQAFLTEGIAEMAVAVEIVSSRFHGWPDIPEWLKLSDLQNHGALILGDGIPYDPSYPFLQPRTTLNIAGSHRAKSPSANPAGDPRHLLAPFIRQCRQRNLPLSPNHWFTTGSYSGVFFVEEEARVMASMEGFPPVTFMLQNAPQDHVWTTD